MRALHGYRVRHWSAGRRSAAIPNFLQREFTATLLNKARGTDRTCIRTWRGWLYLAVVMDLSSRKIIGDLHCAFESTCAKVAGPRLRPT